jgi:predicted HicB family RNase H-like nuclease
MVGIRTDEKTRAAWSRKAKAAGMSLNKWAQLILNNAPEVKPATLVATAENL